MEHTHSWNKRCMVQMVVLLAIAMVLYASNFGHAFHLDSQYGLAENKAIESLANIPSYFTDPFTLTSLRTNADYRPILQITYALNYAVSGQEMWSWHLVQILLHVFNAGCLMALTGLLLPRLLNEPTRRLREWIPFVVALLFLVHPTASGVVNYLWARSSLLTAAFLLPAFLCFAQKRYVWATIGYSLALFTKVEAVGCLAVFAFWLVMLEAEKRHADPNRTGDVIDDLCGVLTKDTLITMAPMMVITLIYAGLRYWLLPDFLAEVRSAPDMTTLGYFSTQLTAWWYYIGHWWAPVDLVADHLTYPQYMSLQEPAVLLALVGWGLGICVLCMLYRTRPAYAFLAASSLALISPHSSFLPLTEMVNEHRPYLPLGLLGLCWIVPGCAFLLGGDDSSRRRKAIGMGTLVSLFIGFSGMTHARNQVFLTWDSYWEDVVAKAPSWRAHTNLGWSYLGQGRQEQAEPHYREAWRLKPSNYLTWSNLGTLYTRQGHHEKALQFHDHAVGLERHTSIGLEARADYFVEVRAYAHAISDLKRALNRTMKPLVVHQQLAHAYAGLGDWESSVQHTLTARDLGQADTENQIIHIVRPFWASREQSMRGIQYFSSLASEWPGRWWIHANWGRLAQEVGDAQLAKEQLAIANRLQPTP